METVNDPAAEREPDGLTPEQIELDRAVQGLDDADDHFVIGRRSAGWPGTDLAPVERIHFDAGHVDQRAACGYDLDRNGPEGWTTDRAKVTCPECAGKLVDEQLVEPERRTVSLETLTDELRAAEPALPDADPAKATWIPDHARVGIVLRADGAFVAIVETDADWIRKHASVALLSRMLQQAEHYAQDGGADLVMPGADVLAALDGRPDATFWTAPVTVRAEDVQEGWIAVGYSGPDIEEPVTAKTAQCKDPGCPWPGDCTALTIGDEEKPQHFADWTLLDVRIPCAVTR